MKIDGDRADRAEPATDGHRLAAMPAVQRLLLALVIALVAGGCQGAGSAIVPGTGPLMTVHMRGGLCPDGMCDSSVILERDGRVHSAAKEPNALGLVSGPRIAALTSAVDAADFAALKSRAFTGVCPIAFDGQELVFEFAAGGGIQRIASCDFDIDWGHPLFVAVATALGEWIPLPLT